MKKKLLVFLIVGLVIILVPTTSYGLSWTFANRQTQGIPIFSQNLPASGQLETEDWLLMSRDAFCFQLPGEESIIWNNGKGVRPGGYLLYKGLKENTPVTISTKVQLGKELDYQEILLAGLATGLDGAKAVGLRWVRTEFPGEDWQLQLFTDTGLLFFDYYDQSIIEEDEIIDLVILDDVTFLPQGGKEYASCLSYNPQTGEVSICIQDLSQPVQCYATKVKINPLKDKVYPIAGWRGIGKLENNVKGAYLCLQTMEIRQEYQGTGLPLLKHQLSMDLKDQQGNSIKNAIDRNSRLKIDFVWTENKIPGYLQLRLFNQSVNRTLFISEWNSRQETTEISLEEIPAGQYRLVLEHINGDQYQVLKSIPFHLINNQMNFEFELYGRNYRQHPALIEQSLSSDPGIKGQVLIRSEKTVKDFPLQLKANFYHLNEDMLKTNGELKQDLQLVTEPEQVITVLEKKIDLAEQEEVVLDFEFPLPPEAGMVELVAINPVDTKISLENNQTRVWPVPLLTAFPGAEGFGAYSVGGRGGKVYIITNLNDRGPGSLREALEAAGPRTVVFAVSGNIRLQSPIRVMNPYLTIAGQTAPGDGICLSGYTLHIETHDVIIRHLRFRPGDVAGVETDSLSVLGGHHVIIDHCSMSWSIDSIFDLTVGSGLNTVQWCILSEALNNSKHAKGAHGYAAGWDGSGEGGSSYHHNLLATCSSRMPRIDKFPRNPRVMVDIRNNVIYNWGGNSSYGGEHADMNWINNYYKSGPATSSSVRSRIFESDSRKNKMYLAGNYVVGFPKVTADNWQGIKFRSGSQRTLRVDQPFKVAPVTTDSAEIAYNRVLKEVGAILPRRDAVDTRVINDVINGTGKIIDTQNQVGGWPDLRTYDVPVDTDQDGMPDWWELANGLDPHDPEDRNLVNHEGYTNLEVYINSLTY